MFSGYLIIERKSMSINGERLKNPICIGEILYSHKYFSEVLRKGPIKSPDQLSTVPVKIVVKRLSNNKVIDLLGIKRIELNKKKTCIWVVCPSNKKTSIFIQDGNIYKLKLKTLSIGDITKSFEDLKKVICTDDGLSLKRFLDIPVKVVITDEKAEKVVDCLDIATTLINDTGSGVFYHCLVDDIRMISENPSLERILDESEKKYADLISKLIKNR